MSPSPMAKGCADALGLLLIETNLMSGSGSQKGHSRWGEYSAMSVDPTDDCRFWYTNERLNQTGDFIWNTHVSQFKLGACQ